MELFPAADQDQFEFIKRVIDDCDYYLLIIGGRYGSITEAGISYTELEYDYAVSKGLKVIALIHDKPDEIPSGKSEKDPKLREKLDQFKAKARTGRLVKFWSSAAELPGLVSLSLMNTIRTYPAVGWIRANRIASEDLLNEVNELRKQKDALEKMVCSLSKETRSLIEGLAELDESIEVHGKGDFRGSYRTWKIPVSWRQIFALIAPLLLKSPTDGAVDELLSNTLSKIASGGEDANYPHLDKQLFLTISIQLVALGLVEIDYSKNTSGVWTLTPVGKELMFEVRTIRSQNSGN